MYPILENVNISNRILHLIIFQFIIGIIIYIKYGIREAGDSFSLYTAMEAFYTDYPSDDSEIVFSRFLRPLSLWLAYPFSFLGYKASLGFQSFIFQLLTIPVFYAFVSRLFQNATLSYYSCIVYILSPMTIRHTFLVLTDLSTWFLYLLTLLFSLKLMRSENINVKKLVILSFVCGFCTLMKENAGSAIIFIGLSILFGHHSKFTHYEKIHLITISFFAFVMPILINNLLVYYFYEFTFIDWYGHQTETYNYNIIEFVASFKNAFGLMVPFAFYYIFFSDNNRKPELYFLLISSLFMFFIFASHVGRFLFLSFPLIIPLSLLGLKDFISKFHQIDLSSSLYRSFVFAIIIINHVLFVDNYDYIDDIITE